MSATEIGTSTTLDFPNVVARRLAEVAIDRERERQETYRRIEQYARIGARERLGHVLDLSYVGYETFVVEIASSGAAPAWAVIRGGRLDFHRFYTVDEALLRLVELRNGGDGNSQGHVYAARMLGADAKPAEEPKP